MTPLSDPHQKIPAPTKSRGRWTRIRHGLRIFFWSGIALVFLAVLAIVGWVTFWEHQVGGDNSATRQKAAEIVADAQSVFAHEPNRWADFEKLLAEFDAERARFARDTPPPVKIDGVTSQKWVPDASFEYDAKSSESEREAGAKFVDALIRSGVLDTQDVLVGGLRFERPNSADRLVEDSWPELTIARGLARADRAIMFRHWQVGGSQDLQAAQTFERMLALGRVFRLQFGSINSLVGIAIQAMALNTVREICLVRPLGEEALALCLEAIRRQTEGMPVKLAFLSDRAVVIDTVQWSFSDDGQGDGTFLTAEKFDFSSLPGGTARKFATGEGFFLAGKKELLAKFDERLNPFLEQAVLLPRDRATATTGDPFGGLSYRFRILDILAPAYGRLLGAHDQILGDIAGTRAFLAIELFRARRKSLPSTLAELVPEFLPTEPIDPFGPGTLKYRRVDRTTDPFGRGFLLYSVGFDRVDNNGLMNEKAPWTALNGAAKGNGFDFVFNTPDIENPPNLRVPPAAK